MRSRHALLLALTLVVLPAASPEETRAPAPSQPLFVPDFVIRGYDDVWDSDGARLSSPDTLLVPVGSRVRWHRESGLHTITDGRGLDDPDAGAHFDYLLDDVRPDFDTTFAAPDTVDYFCAFHEPHMRGVLVISANASVPPAGPPSALEFTRPPAPNPSRGAVTFAVGLPAARRVEVSIHDITGRRIAVIQRGELPAGEHLLRWRGTTDAGARVPSGIYVVWLSDGQRVMARRFTILN
jgi:plastocyanin